MSEELQLAVMLPEKLKVEFKVWCIRHQTTMQKQTIKLIKEFLEKQEKEE